MSDESGLCSNHNFIELERILERKTNKHGKNCKVITCGEKPSSTEERQNFNCKVAEGFVYKNMQLTITMVR